jgi:hypothetical protein
MVPALWNRGGTVVRLPIWRDQIATDSAILTEMRWVAGLGKFVEHRARLACW